MAKFGEWLSLIEGVFDPYIFRAIFAAGGPGAGKSFIVENMFAGLGLKFVASDRVFTLMLKKAGISPTNIDAERDPKQRAIRQHSLGLTVRQMEPWAESGLGLVIDGTGHNFGLIAGLSDELRQKGYDTGMVFVNTDVKVALDRNRRRERTLPQDVVVTKWRDSQKNLGAFQKYFGQNNFLVIDNSKELDAQEIKNLQLSVRRAAMRMLSKPLQNPIGKEKIQQMAGPASQHVFRPPNPQ